VVSGNRQFSTENVRRSLPSLIDGQTPRVREIDTQIQFANENPARQLAITLEEGQQPGQVDARVIVTETPVQRYKLSLDDTGNNQTGRTRLNAAYQNTALSERDDQLVAQLQLSPEKLSAVRVFSAAYRLPLYSAGLMLQAYGSYSNVEAAGTATAAGDLRFAGKGRLLGLQLTHHLQRLGEFEQRISVAADKRDYLNDCAIQGLPSGACGSAGASVTVHPLTLSYDNLRRGARPAGVTLSVATNLALGGSHGSSADFDAVRSDAKRRYSVLFGSGFGSRAFADDWQIAYRAFVQLTRDALVPGERFGLTSVGVVRGYEEREVTGDSAVAGSLELYTPVIRSAAVGDGEFAFGDMRLMTFVDAGEVRNHAGLNCNLVDTRCRLSAIGVGARFALGRSQWRLDLARANSNARETASGDLRLHFQASVVYP
jgi:hemolysin activation/secretion protein